MIRTLYGFEKTAGNNILLLRTGQSHKIYGIARYPDGQLRIVLGMLHGVFQHFAVEHIHVKVMGIFGKITVHNRHEILLALLHIGTQGFGNDGEGIGNAVERIFIVNFGDRAQRRQGSAFVATVHGIGARCKGHALGAPVGRRSGLFAIHHIGGNGQDGQGGLRIFIGGQLLQQFIEVSRYFLSKNIYPVVVVAVAGKVPFYFEVGRNACFVTHHLHFSVLDGRQRIGYDAESRRPVGQVDLGIGIHQSHLQLLVVILVVHVVDDVHGVVVHTSHLFHSQAEVAHDFLQIEEVGLYFGNVVEHLFSGHFAAPAVDGQEQGLGQIGTRPEKLNLFADFLKRHTTSNAVVVAVTGALHQIVVLVLNGRGVDGYLGTEFLEAFGQTVRPQNGHVGLGGGTEIVQGLQEAEGGLGYLVATVGQTTTDGFGNPGGVAGKYFVVGIHAQMAHHTQLHHKLVDQLLGIVLVDKSQLQIVLHINIQKGRYIAQRHGGTILFLDGSEVRQVNPLYSFLRALGGARQVQAINGSQLPQLSQCLNLFGHFLAETNALVGHGTNQAQHIQLLGFDQAIGTIEGHASVIANDATTGIIIGQSG